MSTIPATRARVDALEAEIRALADPPTSTLEQDRRLDAAIVELKEARRADIIRLAETQRHNPELRADTVIVTTKDCYHDEYICRAMELGWDVITEKPMTTTADKCQSIVNAAKASSCLCRNDSSMARRRA